MPPDVCAAHDFFMQEMDRDKGSIAAIFTTLGNMRVDVARLEETTAAGFSNITERQDMFDKTLTESLKRMEKLIIDHRPRKWSPAQKVAMVSAVLGPTGIAAYLAFLK